MAHKALALKEEGNRHFAEGNFKEAETCYSKAIQKDSTNAKLFTNRAYMRIKLQSWDACIDDCIKAIELERNNMKGYYYLAQAQIALNHPNEAFSSAQTAYEECLRTNSPSTGSVSALVLEAKKKRWEVRERDRIRARSDLLRELEDKLHAGAREEIVTITLKLKKGKLKLADGTEEKKQIENDLRVKIEALRNAFALSDPENLQRRVCNGWYHQSPTNLSEYRRCQIT